MSTLKNVKCDVSAKSKSQKPTFKQRTYMSISFLIEIKDKKLLSGIAFLNPYHGQKDIIF